MSVNLHFVSYAAGSFKNNIKSNSWFVRAFIRPKTVKFYTDKDLRKTNFYQSNKKLLDESRGAGYWVWKPYFILERLKSIPEGEMLIYQDCGFGYRFKNFIYPRRLIEFTEHYGCVPGVYIPERGNNLQWTKKDVFVRMDCDSEEYWGTPQVQATISLWKNNAANRAFITLWLDACCNRKLVSDDVSLKGCVNHPDFVEHRHDQSLLTLLTTKYKLAIPNQSDEVVLLNKSISMIELHLRAKTSIYYKYLLKTLLGLQYLMRKSSIIKTKFAACKRTL